MTNNGNVTPDSILQVASGFLTAKYLFVANEAGLFEILAEGPATLDELSKRTAISRRTLRILVDAMVALGFLERQEDRYQNGPVVATFLSGRFTADLRPFLRFWNRVGYLRWIRLEEAIRTDQIIFAEFTEEEQQLYCEAVEAVTAGAAKALATTYDFNQHRRVLDLGGGTGSFLAEILSHYSWLETTLFELPSVATIARRRLIDSPFLERIQIIEGDFFEDPIPGGYDAVILANIVHNLSPERDLELLRRIRTRVPHGARLLLVDFWADPTRTQPRFAALMAGEFLLTPGGGDVYSVVQAWEWFLRTGWQPLEHIPLVGPASLIVAETA